METPIGWTSLDNIAVSMSAGKSKAPQELDLKLLAARIQERIDARETNALRLAVRAGLGKTAVHDILSGKNKKPSVLALRRIAFALETTASYLMGETDDPDVGVHPRGIGPIPVIGIAEAGAFRPMADIDHAHEHELPRIFAPRSSSYPDARHFAVTIRGDSMNAAKPVPLVEGMHALCVDLADAGLTVETGRIYVVRATRDAGQTYEVTIKRAFVFRDRIELRPESTNPRHRTIVLPKKTADAGAEEVRAIGWVYGVFSSMEL